ncbi:HAD-IIIC family phosphatase [Frankia sp. AgB1.8]|nr:MULTISPECIES: HAD-IIIC family phosphatase [unclassified Frankia]MBL7624593.1 HAD-IIIC family phosphatase [Frankia sp. AgB1.8]
MAELTARPDAAAAPAPATDRGTTAGPAERDDAATMTDRSGTATDGSAADFGELHRAGLLVEHYPRVRGLLATMTGTELARAGRLLAGLDVDAVLARHPVTPTVTVAVTGSGTLTGLVAPLAGELARHGLLLRPVQTDFGSYVQELAEPDSELHRAGAGLAVCALDAEVVFDKLPPSWGAADVERVLAEEVDLLRALTARFCAHSSGTLVLTTLPLPRTRLVQLVDHRSRARLSAVWREANARLLRTVDEHTGVVVIDLDALIAEGIPAAEPRLSTYARAHLSPELLARLAVELGHLARHITGRTKKCLALDLDNTVWGGVLGEVGPEGIEVSDGYRGEAFRAFQCAARQLAGQGVLLAAVSKNDLEPVRAVLRGDDRMSLREDDFVRVIANWRPKHDNLRELADGLNIGLESIVFVDDSSFECGLVRRALPEVAVVEVTAEPALHVTNLLRDGWFDVIDVTAEDRARPARYREEQERTDFLRSFESLADYLRELDVQVRLAPVVPADVPRVSQLTLRTNQFNLTTERLARHQVQELVDAPDAEVLAIHSSDRFGENGLVGAIFLRRGPTALEIDNFLLSCRVFSRGIELACLASVLAAARRDGAAEVVARYRPTSKNGKVADFYPRNGFAETTPPGQTERVFRHPLADIPDPPAHVRIAPSAERTKG